MSQDDRLQEIYTDHHTGHSRYGFSYRVAERGPQFMQWVGIGQRVLDIGCRDGSLTRYYSTNNHVTGIDIDPHALSIAQDELGIDTLQLNLNEDPLPYEPDSIDVVVAGEVLEHLVSPAAIAKEALRVLKPGGKFIGSVPNGFHWRNRLAFIRGYSLEDATHLQLFSLDRVHKLLRNFAPLTIVPVGGIGGRRLPILPARLAQPLVQRLPTLFASDFLFCAIKPA